MRPSSSGVRPSAKRPSQAARRPTAQSTASPSAASGLPFTLKWTRTPVSVGSARSTRAPVQTRTFFFLRIRARFWPSSRSSMGSSRSRPSRMVTDTPRSEKKQANSMPMTPPPMMTRER